MTAVSTSLKQTNLGCFPTLVLRVFLQHKAAPATFPSLLSEGLLGAMARENHFQVLQSHPVSGWIP